MNTLAITKRDNIDILKLDRGTANPINLEMMKELSQYFRTVESNDEVGGVVLTGNPGIFTAGLDVVELYNLDKDGAYDFWEYFVDLVTQLTAFSKPLIAAIPGHSPAGGCIFACCADYRLMLQGDKFRIGLNEIPVGIVVPERVLHLYSFWIGQRRAYQYLMEAKLMSPKEAFEVGLIDELCLPEDLLPRAMAKMQAYLDLPQETWRMSKRKLRNSLINTLNVDFDETYGDAMEQFWTDENRAIMGALVEKLKQKKGGV